jgi:hypothetical protein
MQRLESVEESEVSLTCDTQTYLICSLNLLESTPIEPTWPPRQPCYGCHVSQSPTPRHSCTDGREHHKFRVSKPKIWEPHGTLTLRTQLLTRLLAEHTLRPDAGREAWIRVGGDVVSVTGHGISILIDSNKFIAIASHQFGVS